MLSIASRTFVRAMPKGKHNSGGHFEQGKEKGQAHHIINDDDESLHLQTYSTSINDYIYINIILSHY